MSELLTVAEFAERARLGKRTIERMMAAGEIRSAKIGRRRLIAADELERLVRTGERRGRVA